MDDSNEYIDGGTIPKAGTATYDPAKLFLYGPNDLVYIPGIPTPVAGAPFDLGNLFTVPANDGGLFVNENPYALISEIDGGEIPKSS